jgi:hypothetical protein
MHSQRLRAGCGGDRGYIRSVWQGLLPWEGNCLGGCCRGYLLGGNLRLRTAARIRAIRVRVEREILTCTNLMSAGRMRNNLKALARKLRSSKYFFLI